MIIPICQKHSCNQLETTDLGQVELQQRLGLGCGDEEAHPLDVRIWHALAGVVPDLELADAQLHVAISAKAERRGDGKETLQHQVAKVSVGSAAPASFKSACTPLWQRSLCPPSSALQLFCVHVSGTLLWPEPAQPPATGS